MEAKAAREKKKGIIDYFTSYNQFFSEKNFDKVKYKLHDACEDGDLELVKILSK